MAIRAFLAVELPEALRAELSALQEALCADGADVAWVKPANLHLTLKFLGEIDEGCVAKLEDALRPTALHHPPFTLMLEGVGAFPSARRPRVVWVGVSHGAPELTALARAIAAACATQGFPVDPRPFSAHLTIGRVRSSRGLPPLIAALARATFRAGGPAPVRHVTLFQSTLSPEGPIYTPRAAIPLA